MKTLTLKKEKMSASFINKVKMAFVHVVVDGAGTSNQKAVVFVPVFVGMVLIIATLVHVFHWHLNTD